MDRLPRTPCGHAEQEFSPSIALAGRRGPKEVIPFPAHVLLLPALVAIPPPAWWLALLVPGIRCHTAWLPSEAPLGEHVAEAGG